jgi:hypothetical protein
MTVASPSLPDAAVGLGAKIGRYFSVVSILPALFLVLWTAALIVSGAWEARPNFSTMTESLGKWSLAGAGWIVVGTVVAALFLHPLQLGMTRVLEGYWGRSRLARIALRRRISHHRRRQAKLRRAQQRWLAQRNEILDDLILAQYEEKRARGNKTVDPDTWDENTRDDRRVAMLETWRASDLSGLQAALDSVPRALARYPDTARMMPTRLGNALRAGEDSIGSQYGLSTMTTASHIAFIAPDSQLNYLRDSRQQLDTSVRLCVVALIATAESAVSMFADGWWLCTALIPYFLSYVAYRASVAAADEYMAVVRAMLDLNRFKLYESLHVKLPRNSAEERRTNAKLMDLLGGNMEVRLTYKHPASEAPNTDTPATPPGNP